MNLFGNQCSARPSSIRLDVFHDERILEARGWLYHGMTFVPVDEEDWFINELKKPRGNYNGFVHFVELDNPPAQTPQGMKAFVAKSWAKLYVNDTRNTRRVSHYNNFCVTVLGINLNNLNQDCFGENVDQNIFVRFFRTTLLSGIKYFYGHDFSSISVRHVFHGTTDLGANNPLRWHPMWRIERNPENNISFEQNELTLLNADHRLEKQWTDQSQIIQFTDVILGATSQCLDSSSSQRGCREVANEIMPVVTRLTTASKNINSRYHRKYSLNFFPSKKLSLVDLRSIERHASRFYTQRVLKLAHRNQTQLGSFS